MRVGRLCFLGVSRKRSCFEGTNLYMRLPCLCADTPLAWRGPTHGCAQDLDHVMKLAKLLCHGIKLALGHAWRTFLVASCIAHQ